jgi:hypothetical protein
MSCWMKWVLLDRTGRNYQENRRKKRFRQYLLVDIVLLSLCKQMLGWIMAYSGTLRRVALVRTDVSEELSTSFIRVTTISEVGTTLAVTSNRRTLRRNTPVLTRATRRNIPEDAIHHSHRRRNLKSYKMLGCFHSFLSEHCSSVCTNHWIVWSYVVCTILSNFR